MSVVPCERWRERCREEGSWWLRGPCRQRRVTKSPCRSCPGLPLHKTNPAVNKSGGHPARELVISPREEPQPRGPSSRQTTLDTVPGAGSPCRSVMPTP